MTTKTAPPRGGRELTAGHVISGLVALTATLTSMLVVGALVARAVGAGAAAWGAAYAATIALALALPIALGVKVAGSEPKAAIVTGATATLNVLYAALAIGLAPSASRAALTTHGTWFLAGHESAAIAGAVRALADRIPRSEAPPIDEAAIADDAPDAGPPDAGAPDAGPRDAGAPRASAEPTGPWSATQLYAQRGDAVVTIQVRMPVREEDPLASILEDLGMDAREGSGSGFIVEREGIIVTNHHVIGGAAAARVTLRDGRTFDHVRLLAIDPANDLGVLAIDATDLPVAPLAPSGELAVGATVFAIGSPLGLDHTLTQGIVSAIRGESGTTFVQTQAPIAPGSSGGPLFDELGRVVGVNTATRSAGLNFSVHVDHVRALLAGPRASRALDAYGEAPHAASVELEGAPLRPTARMALEPLGVAIARVGARCITSWPAEGAAPVITVQLSARARDERLSSDQGADVDRCLRSHGGMASFQAVLVAEDASHESFTATVLVEGIAPARSVRVRFVRAAP